MENTSLNTQNPQEENVQLKDIISRCLSNWYWFVISVILCLGCGIFYILKTPPVYTRSAQIMIKTNNNGRSIGGETEQFAELGLFSTNTNVYNEIKAISSKASMAEVVRRLNLDMNYSVDGRFHDNVLYGHSLPVKVEVLDCPDNAVFSFDLDFTDEGAIKLSAFTIAGEPSDKGLSVKGSFADTLSTPAGYVIVNPTTDFMDGIHQTIHVSRKDIQGTAGKYSSELTVALSDKMSQVVNLSIEDISTQRAEDILNTLVSVYNENWVADKNQIAVSTSMFINERLGVIEQELATVDNDISSYKSENLVPDIKAASSMYMSQSNTINTQINDLNNELYMTRYIKTYLTNEANVNQLLPANSGISSPNIENQIKDYNTKLLQRNDLLANSSITNPLVVEMDNSLSGLRQAIITSVDNQILALNNQISSLQRSERQATSRIAANPNQARYLLSVERQQSVKEALYLFLLQKREENELSQAFTAYNTRIIDPPAGSRFPSAPRKEMIMLLALLIGLCIPLGIIYASETLNSTVRGKKDLKNLKMPFAGEIPLVSGKVRSKAKQADNERAFSSSDMLVRGGKRDTVNEAFRVLRTNVEFMSANSESKVVAMVSFNPGSGKSFVGANLAAALAVKGKKVVAVDCDLRHASLSKACGSPKTGLSNYLSGQTDDVDSLFCQQKDYESLFILPVGTIPPNPTELVSDPRFAELVDRLKARFDYVLLDCPPVDIVADAQIINTNVDRTLFVIRAGLCERSMLAELNKFYEEGRFKNLSVILNGTELTKPGYFGSKYGYQYNYQGNYHYQSYHSYVSDKD